MRNKRARCQCGKVMSKYANQCNACHAAKLEEIFSKNRQLVATGKCPTCGRGLVRNLSMKGWWQCEQLGAKQFRKYPELPSCDWQAFTER